MAIRTPNSFLVFCGSLLALLIVAILFVWSIAAGPQPSDLDKKRAENRIAVRTKLEKEATDTLTTEAMVDKAKGIVRVPVASVFAATARELAAKKPAPSQVKVEPPLPMPVIDPKATEPPPPALPSAPQGADTIRFASVTPEASPAAAAPAPAAAPAVPAPNPPPVAPAPPTPTAPAPAAPSPAPAPAPNPQPVPPTPPAPAPPASTAPVTPPAPAAPAPNPQPVPPAPAPVPPAPAPPASTTPATPPAPAAPAPNPQPAPPAPAPAPPVPAPAPDRPPLINSTDPK